MLPNIILTNTRIKIPDSTNNPYLLLCLLSNGDIYFKVRLIGVMGTDFEKPYTFAKLKDEIFLTQTRPLNVGYRYSMFV